MKAIEILETLSTEIKKGEYVGNIGIIVRRKSRIKSSKSW